MTAQELIASGLLEAYVLGEGTAEERALVERLRASDRAVRDEIDAIEGTLESHARAVAVAPPVRVRAIVLKAIGGTDHKVVALPARSAGGITLNWLAAASIGALLLSAAGNFILYRQLGQVRDRLAGLENERTVLAQELKVQQASLKDTESQLAVVFDPHKRVVALAGQALDPKAGARVFWDAATHEVYIDVLSLPAPPPGKQYQLWAQVDGVMVDAGLFEVGDTTRQVQHMKDAANATAFGVTLENEGGSSTPTLTALYLLGAVS